MQFISLSGRKINKNIEKYRMDWDCPERSKVQFLVKTFLFPYWKNHVVYRELTIPQTRLKIDIYNATKRLAIEVDGNQHDSFNKFFHGNRIGYLNSIKRDVKKEKFCEINNINLIRITEKEIKDLSREFFKEKFDIDL